MVRASSTVTEMRRFFFIFSNFLPRCSPVPGVRAHSRARRSPVRCATTMPGTTLMRRSHTIVARGRGAGGKARRTPLRAVEYGGTPARPGEAARPWDGAGAAVAVLSRNPPFRFGDARVLRPAAVEGEQEAERAPLVEPALGLDPPAMGLGHLLDDREAEAGALGGVAPGVGRPRELDEEVGEELGRDADALVAHLEHAELPAAPHLDVHRAAGPGVLERVVDEVLDRVLEVRRHAAGEHDIGVVAALERNLPRLGHRRERVGDVDGELREVDAGSPRGALRGLAQLGEFEQVADDAQEPLDPFAGAEDQARRARRGGVDVALEEDVEAGLDRGQWGAELVRREQHEVRLARLDRAHLGAPAP